MARMKATVKRLNAAPKVNFGWKRVYPFKIRQTLPPQKTVDIKKNRQVIKTINVRRKSKYFFRRNRLIFQILKYIFLN